MSSSTFLKKQQKPQNFYSFVTAIWQLLCCCFFFLLYVCSNNVTGYATKLVKFLYYRCLKRCLSVSLHKLAVGEKWWKKSQTKPHLFSTNKLCCYFINSLKLNHWLVWLIQVQFLKWLKCQPFKLITQSKPL